MKVFLLVLALGFLILISIFVYRRRMKKRSQVHRSGEKHSTGYLKYHSKTSTKIKQALHTKKGKAETRAIAVIAFKGDLRASANLELSHLIDEVILNSARIEELVVVLSSPGGSVTDYGYSYALMERVRNSKIQLTVCIDTVAASGGYLMSLPANKILAGPFAMVGSIGVVSFVPNIRKLLQRFDIEPRTFTAGDFKRTVTLTDDATPEQVELYKKQLQLIHDQFKNVISKYRPTVDLARAATGEAWLAQNSVELKLGLVDGIVSSSEYLLMKNQDFDLVFFEEKTTKNFWSQIFSKFLMSLTESFAI